MDQNINGAIANYKEMLQHGEMRMAYMFLVKYVMRLKSSFEGDFGQNYSCGNASPGYMDYTKFSFIDSFLRQKKLRFGIVLNHEKMRFELWLMGQNANVQNAFWDLLKTSIWNKGQLTMPRYSVLEVVLVDNPDFNDLDSLTASITHRAHALAHEISEYIGRVK